MDAELQHIADDLDKIAVLFERLDQRFGAGPQPLTGSLVYMSGRWKLRDGTMYGR